MSARARTKDIDIRIALVRCLLDLGFERRAIRHEITLDASSSDGRADVVVLRPGMIVGCEIKSARDRLERLKEQRPRYSARFDRIVLFCDEKHSPWGNPKLNFYGWEGWEACSVSVGPDGIEFHKNYWTGFAALETPLRDAKLQSGHLSARGMLEMLWAPEVRSLRAKHLGGADSTRTAGIPWLAENVPLKDIREGVIAALLSRQLNRWEEKFWAAFDASEKQAA